MIEIWSKKTHHVRLCSDSRTPTKLVTGWYCKPAELPNGKNFENIYGPFSSRKTAVEVLKEMKQRGQE